MEVSKRLGWLKSGRFLRLASAVTAGLVLSAIIYNAVFVDRIPPTCKIHLSSAVTSTGQAPRLTSVGVDFSEGVKQDTAEQAFSISPSVTGSFHWQGLTMIFTPTGKLPLSTKFHVRMGPGVQDLAGNSQGAQVDIDFATVGAPVVASVSPLTGTGSVGVDDPIVIRFDRYMDVQKVVAGLTVDPAFNYQISWDQSTLTLTPTRPLEFGTVYTVKIGDPAVDTDGTGLASYSTSFKTVDVGLRVSKLIPSPNVAGVSVHSQIAVMFDAPIDPASVSNAIKLTPPVSGTTKAVSLADDRKPALTASASAGASAAQADAGARVLVFTPDRALAPHTTYAVSMASTVKKANGEVGPAQSWSFTTGEAPADALNQIAFISNRSGVDNVWLMNPDGSNQREITSEMVPVAGFDISSDGTSIAYSAGGVVRKMSIGGESLETLTPPGNFEYAPVYTPDGAGLIVARRDARGDDAGYWKYSPAGGRDTRQVATSGAPRLGSGALGDDGLTGEPGVPAWSGRAAFSADGSTMLVVRGLDGLAEIVDLKGANTPVILDLVGNSRPVWVPSAAAFYLTATNDKGATWNYWAITPAGIVTKLGPSTSDIATSAASSTTPGASLSPGPSPSPGASPSASASGVVALLVKGADGSIHLQLWGRTGSTPLQLTSEISYSETSPSFSPDGSTIVFGRVSALTPGGSAGIWVVKVDGTGLTNLSVDGAYPRWLP